MFGVMTSEIKFEVTTSGIQMFEKITLQIKMI